MHNEPHPVWLGAVMFVSRLAAVLVLVFSFGAAMSHIVGRNVDYVNTQSTSMSLCDSSGRRPCP
jgi:hypothetical protein